MFFFFLLLLSRPVIVIAVVYRFPRVFEYVVLCIRVDLFYLVVIIHAVPVTVRCISCPYAGVVCVSNYFIYTVLCTV